MSHEEFAERDNWKSSHRAGRKRSAITFKYCRKHDRVEEATSRCFRAAGRSASAPAVHTFKPFYNTVMDHKPVLIESKAQYRRECAKRNQVCPL